MDMKTNVENRVKWIKDILESTGARGIIYGNSGGKDCTLVGALCRMATENVLGVIMPCQSSANYGSDRTDAIAAGERFGIRQIEVDLTAVKEALVAAMGEHLEPADAADGAVRSALININPRLRMTTLYALGQARGYLVAGTGNLCDAGLYPGQTDEVELGVTYADISAYLRGGELSESMRRRIAGMEERTEHKRRMPRVYPD